MIALDKAEQLLNRDVLAVDLRNAARRPMLRLDAAMRLPKLREAQGLIETVSE